MASRKRFERVCKRISWIHELGERLSEAGFNGFLVLTGAMVVAVETEAGGCRGVCP